MIRAVLAAALLGGFLLPVCAQHNHEQGHSSYRTWRSLKAPYSCCNEQDCRGVSDSEIRQTDVGPEIFIDGEWCPVNREHYTVRGNRSPDWSVAHACIRQHGSGCDRLLCYMPAGGF